MVFLLALVGALAVAVVLWRVIEAQRVVPTSARRSPVAPDDDPDFLRQLSEQQRRREDGEK